MDVIYSHILGKWLTDEEFVRLWKLFMMLDWADPKEWRD
jgi:hypothetical protein